MRPPSIGSAGIRLNSAIMRLIHPTAAMNQLPAIAPAPRPTPASTSETIGPAAAMAISWFAERGMSIILAAPPKKWSSMPETGTPSLRATTA